MKPTTAILSLFSSALVLLASGCAGLSETECRTADWYSVGERDGLIYGLRPQVEQYAEQCGRYGIQPARQEYLAGWFYGERERGIRLGGENP
jgi:uncharacterized protein DUF2799